MSMVNVRNLGFGGSGIPDSLPQAIAELQGLRLSVVEGAAAGTVMVVPGMDPEDTIGAAVDLTTPASIDPATLSVQGRNAFATIECLETAAEDDTITVNGRVYTIKDVVVHTSYNAPPGVIPIDTDPSGTDVEVFADRLAKAIMSGDSTLTAAVEGNGDSPELQSVVRVRVREAGEAGNEYTLAETGTAATISGALFTGGADSSESGFICEDSLAGKDVLVLWYDRNPSDLDAPQPLLARRQKLRAMRFRGGKQEEIGPDDGRRDDDKGREEDKGRDDKGREKSGPSGPGRGPGRR